VEKTRRRKIHGWQFHLKRPIEGWGAEKNSTKDIRITLCAVSTYRGSKMATYTVLMELTVMIKMRFALQVPRSAGLAGLGVLL